MAMETSLACSFAAAAAALFAVSLFSLSTLPRVSAWRRSTSAAHAAFVMPGGLSLGARGFLAFGDPLRRHGDGREEEDLQLWGISAGKMGICGAFWRETKLMTGTTLSLADTAGPLAVSRVFISSEVPERASESRRWSGLAG
jgi:hypothetical protein